MALLSHEESMALIKRIKPAHPDKNLGISLPWYQHDEENRQAHIRHWHYHHPGGWLPSGDNWWLFPMSNRAKIEAEKQHIAINKSLREQGWNLYDDQEPEE